MSKISVISVLIRLEGGGAERSVARMIQPLGRRGINMVRYAIDSAWPGEEDDPEKTLAIGSKRGVRRVVSASISLAKIIRLQRPDVVHLHCEAPEMVGLMTKLLTLRHKYGIVVTDHSMNSWSGARSPIGGLIRFFLRSFHAVFVSCFLSGSLGHKMRVILNPTGAISRLSPSRSGSPRLVVIGRVIDSKRIDQVLRAAQQCSWPHEVLIIGAGPASNSLRALSKELGLHATFLGHKSDPWSFVRASDIFVSASAFEGEPLTLIEALQNNLPILASKIPGHIRVLGDHEGIFSTTSELATLLAAYNQSPAPKDVFRVNVSLLNKILNERDPERIAHEWESLYRSLAQSGRVSAG